MSGRPSRSAGRKAVPPALRALVRRVGATRRKQVQRILARSLEILPHYRGLSPAARKSVRDNVLYQVDLFYRASLLRGRRLTAAELERSRQNARLRAYQGVPLGEFLGVYQIGNAIVWEDLVASAQENAEERAQLFERLASITANNIQLMSAVTEAYVEERESLSRFRERDLDDFFQLLLAEEVSEGLLELRAKALGVRLEDPHSVIFFRPAAPLENEGGGVAAENLRRLLLGAMKERDALVGRSPGGFLALVPGEPDPEGIETLARRLFGGAVRVGLGRPGARIEGLRRSMKEAVRALEIGSNAGEGGILHRYQDLAVLDLLRPGSGDAEAFARSVLGPLARRGRNAQYLDTLRALARSGFRIKIAAAALSIHPHTLTYRMKQIQDRFGIDLEDVETRLRVHLALLIIDAGKRTAS